MRGGRFDRDRPIVTEAVARIRTHAAHILAQQRSHLVTLARGATHKAAGADDDKIEDLQDGAAALDYGQLAEVIRPELEAIAKDAAHLGMDQVSTPEIDRLLSQANEKAIAWARERSGALVTQVAETTRQAVADLTAQALDEGWSNDTLADALDSSDAFGPDRAEMIARTETAMADVQGNLIGWKESGLVAGKEWLVAQDGECDDCEALEGVVVPLDGEFDEGDPPLHPNCRCTVLPVLGEGEEEGDGGE